MFDGCVGPDDQYPFSRAPWDFQVGRPSSSAVLTSFIPIFTPHIAPESSTPPVRVDMSESRPLVNSSSASSAISSSHVSSSASSATSSSRRPLLPPTCAVPVFTVRSQHERPPIYPNRSVEFLQRRNRDQRGEAVPPGSWRRTSALVGGIEEGRKWVVAPPPPPLHLQRSCSAHSNSHSTCWFQPSSGVEASVKSPQRLPSQGYSTGGVDERVWQNLRREKAPPSCRTGVSETPDIGDDGDQNEMSPVYKTSSRKGQKLARREQGPLEYRSWKELCLDFCARTSSHGVPFMGTHSFFGRIVWGFITVVAFLALSIQTYYTLSDYFEYRTIIEMQLRFEPAPFPAATVCNLNSFKFSELKKFEEIAQGFQLWERAIATLKAAEQEQKESRSRKRRQVTYQAVYVKCVCNLGVRDQCVPTLNELDLNTSVCLCFQDAKTGDIWPCYAKSVWHEKKCFHCSHSHTCDDPDQPNQLTTLLTVKALERDCLCQSVSHYCIERSSNETISWWNPHNYTSYPATEPPTASSEVEEAFGLEDLKDRGAITTKTKENLIFMVAQLPRETRRQLSYTLDEFVLRCSFNSKDCDMGRDFQIHLDPDYGNCFTFNCEPFLIRPLNANSPAPHYSVNDSVELKNSRAGPMYGLRLLLNVNQSDYMPTTEAAGVRLVVHEQDQEPFPDTFGYSAPTGFISSFGLKTVCAALGVGEFLKSNRPYYPHSVLKKILHRLDAPYGECSDSFRPEGYIYAEHYSPEGCYRNCFQHTILERCGCGDPRFPLPSDKERPCDARNARQKACLANETSVLGGFHHLTHDCNCVQPCTENVFETAYSSAAWPATNFIIGAECTSMLETDNYTHGSCSEYYRQNTAYIEIYYEQLNFESLNETAGYTLVNLFSDLGGNIGLWIGFSLITVLEFLELLLECIAYGGRRALNRHRRRGGSWWSRGQRTTPSFQVPDKVFTQKQSSSLYQTRRDKGGRRHGLVLAHYPYVSGSASGGENGRLVYSNDDYSGEGSAGDKHGIRSRRSILRTPPSSTIVNRTRGSEGGSRGVRWREEK